MWADNHEIFFIILTFLLDEKSNKRIKQKEMKTQIFKPIFTVFTLIFMVTTVSSQNVTIPDAAFKAALVGNTSINTNSDSEIQVSEAAAYNGAINVSNLGIHDLTGIEAFTSLTFLNCNYNNLPGLNISTNTALIYLDCSADGLTSLNISTNTNLLVLNCTGNQITNLNLSSNPSLVRLECSWNPLTTLITSSNPALMHIDCNDNMLTSLNLSSNTNLDYLQCQSNQLTSLDLSANASLDTLFCAYNQLTALDVSICTSLTWLLCNQNQISGLDLSTNTILTVFNCSGNQLTNLNIKNGGNTGIIEFDATNNTSLSCIQVDDPSYSAANALWTKPSTATYSIDCSGPSFVNIPNANFKSLLVNDLSINTDGDSEIQYSEAAAFSGTIYAGSLSINDLTGIEAFTALTGLSCYDNLLTTLDLSSNIALTHVWCYSNQLTSVILPATSTLAYFYCQSNQLTSLDVSANPSLEFLMCSYNQLTNLDVSANPNITALSCESNQLVSLNLKNGNNINMGNSSFHANLNPDLTCIQVDNSAWSTTNWTDIDPGAIFSTNCLVGINEFDLSSAISISPNPNNGIFTIQNPEMTDLHLKIYNVLGEMIYSEIISSKQTSSNINISYITKGMYFALISDNRKSYAIKLDVE